MSQERGNALLYILIAVVLVAALTYAIAASLRGNAGISQETVSLTASDIVASGNRLTEAVARIRLREYTKAQICFTNTIVAGYGTVAGHPDCQTGSRVFEVTGGGLSWEVPPPGAGQGQPWGYTGNIAVQELGSTQGELIAILPYLTLDVCQKINTLLGVSNPPPVVSAITNANKFIGTYTSGTTFGVTVKGKKAACVEAPSATGTAANPAAIVTPNQYFYYHVLLTN